MMPKEATMPVDESIETFAEIPSRLPILPVRDVVIFPFMRIPLLVGRPSSIRAVDEALARDRYIFCVAQREMKDEDPLPNGIYQVGCICSILRMHKMPDCKVKLTVLGFVKGRVRKLEEEDGIVYADIEKMADPKVDLFSPELEALIRHIRELLEKIVALGKVLSPEVVMEFDDIQDPGNFGTIIRTADWFGITNIICSEDCVEVYNPKVIQATMGSLFRVNVFYTNLGTFFSKNSDLTVYGALLDGDNVCQQKLKSKGSVLLMGNESNGISQKLIPFVTKKITIPKFGKAESLNVATATAILCYEYRRFG